MLFRSQSNPHVFAAPQTIDGDFSLFGAYDITDSSIAADLEAGMKDIDAKTPEEFEAQVLALITYAIDKYADGNLDNFLQHFASLNWDKALAIELYDEKGKLTITDPDGKGLTITIEPTHVRVGRAIIVTDKTNEKTDNDTDSDSDTDIDSDRKSVV